MKIISSILLTLSTGAALMSATVAPAAATTEKKDNNQTAQAVKVQQVAAPQASNSLNGAIKVIAPQKDLEAAIRNSEQGDILLLGPEGWYRIEGKALQQGTKMYVLGAQGSMISAFPKEADSATR